MTETDNPVLEKGDFVVEPNTRYEYLKDGLRVYGAVGTIKKVHRNANLVDVSWRANKTSWKRTHSPDKLVKVDVTRYKKTEETPDPS